MGGSMKDMLPVALRLVAAMLVLAAALTLSDRVAFAEEGGRVPGGVLGDRGDAEIWRQIRHGAPGTTSLPDRFAGTLIRATGDQWREIRAQWLVPYGGIPILAMVTLVILFYLVRGRIRIENGRSGRRVKRFSLARRTAHWFAASLFILLAISGLLLMFGRPVLIPLIGKPAFAALASAALQGHNLFGPLFVLALAFLIPLFFSGNLFDRTDIGWILKGGGLIGRGHASSRRNNFGEKVWYWLIAVFGTTIAISGILLDFPWLATRIEYLNLAQIAHATAAIVLISVAVGHIYIGSLGMEGALEGMTMGTVDENWAIQHHDLWVKEMVEGDRAEAGADAGAGRNAEPPPEPAE